MEPRPGAALALAAGSACRSCSPSAARRSALPVARSVIYPGDMIRETCCRDIPAQTRRRARVALSRSELIGKMARRTLLPGRSIPIRRCDDPRVVSNGAEVKMVYIDGGLTIVTTGAALQDGGVGEVIKMRNERQRRNRHRPRAARTAQCW